MLLLIGLLFAGWFFNWPEQWGLVASPSEKLFESPNPWAGEALEAELVKLGQSSEGITVYVLPGDDGSNVAYILLEEAKGYKYVQAEVGDNAIEGTLVLAAGTQAVSDYSIGRIAVDHRDDKGAQAAVMTAPVDKLLEYGGGALTQEQVFEYMDGYADLTGFLGGMTE